MKRFRITLSTAEPVHLPHWYRELLQAAVYDLIALSSPRYAEWLHTKGYSLDEADSRTPRTYKSFAFSPLSSASMQKTPYGILLQPGKVRWEISGGHPDFCEHLAEGLLRAGVITIAQSTLEITAFEELAVPDFSRGMMDVFCVSPLVMRTFSPVRQTKEFLFPRDGERYQEAIKLNLIRKHLAILGRLPVHQLFALAQDRDYLRHHDALGTVRYKRGNLVGIIGRLHLSGSQELLRMAYYCGLGENNTCGLGMIS